MVLISSVSVCDAETLLTQNPAEALTYNKYFFTISLSDKKIRNKLATFSDPNWRPISGVTD